MAFGNLVRKKLSEIGPDGAKILEMTGAKTFGEFAGMVTKQIPIGGTIAKSVATPVDVSAEGMKKKNLPRGTGVTYSGVKTSSQGLLTGAKTEKKTLLGG
jgi:hypothetical protein